MLQVIREIPEKLIILTALLAIVLISGSAHAMDKSSKVVCRVDTDRGILPAGDPQNVVLKVTLEAPEAPSDIKRPLVNLALVLDQSGSMGGTKMEQAKAAAIEAVSRLGRGDIFSAVVYDTNVDTIVPAQNAGNIDSIIARIKRISSGGSTNLFGGVSQGASEVRKNLDTEFIHRIILLSDGLANVGPRTPGDLGRLGAALIKENISVSTVGVGTDYNEDLMAQLAQKSDGNTYFVESGYDLPRIFSSELGDVLNVVAKKVKVIITLPGNVTFVDIVGREGRFRGNKVELSMNQLYGGQEKYALIEVKVPESRAGSKIKIAHASVVYENPFNQKTLKSSGVSYASFSDDKKKIEKSTNIDVVREYQLNLNALAQEKAIELSDKGRNKEAAFELKKSASKLNAVGSILNDSILLETADELEEEANKIEKEGMKKKMRKSLRTKSYQLKNQQYSK